MIDFKKDLKDIVLRSMNYHGIKYKGNDSLEQLLIKLYTFYGKYIVPKKRTVYLAAELSTKLSSLPVTTQKSVKKLSEWITDGVDINGYQSNGLYGQGSRDYQNMLYGVVHLHLSADENDVRPIIKKGRFAKRGKYLLFALFKTDAAYFIDIQPHPSALTSNNTSTTEWTSASLIKIIENNWPELLANAKLPITALCDQGGNEIKIDDQGIATLISNHINTAVQGNDGFYMLGGAVASGDSAKAARVAQNVINTATKYELWYKENQIEITEIISRILKKRKNVIPATFDIHFGFVPYQNKFFIVERHSGLAIDPANGKVSFASSLIFS